MKIKILSQRRNNLLRRREVTFEIVHEKGGTPTRLETRQQLSTALDADIGCVYIKKIETKTGSVITVGEANVYDSVEQAEKTEPDYIVSRNVPKEKAEGGE